MFKNNLENIEGIGIYPLISLMIFFLFFIVMFIWVFKADKKQLEEMSHVPFANNDELIS
jgi:cbb3-type cytochrome oxidase subunit 3